MKTSISEFSYGYALTENLIVDSRIPVTAAPVFPSLIEEGKENIGYDVKIQYGAVAVLLQFKLTDYHTRAQSKYSKIAGLPYYQFHLRSSRFSSQHASLLMLESRGYSVFYAAPKFHKPDQLNNFYLERCVLDQSFFINPSAIGQLPDNKDHSIVFNDASTLFCSTPRRLDAETDYKHFVTGIYHRIQEDLRQRPEDIGEKLLKDLIEIIGQGPNQPNLIPRTDLHHFFRHPSPLMAAAYLSRTFLNSELFLFQIRN